MLLRIDDVVSGFKKKKETKSGPVAAPEGAPEQETVNFLKIILLNTIFSLEIIETDRKNNF
jgi:hypothetical protein